MREVSQVAPGQLRRSLLWIALALEALGWYVQDAGPLGMQVLATPPTASEVVCITIIRDSRAEGSVPDPPPAGVGGSFLLIADESGEVTARSIIDLQRVAGYLVSSIVRWQSKLLKMFLYIQFQIRFYASCVFSSPALLTMIGQHIYYPLYV